MTLRFLHLIGLFALFQALFLSFSLARSRQGHSLCRRLFAGLLFVFALQIFYSFTHSVGVGSYFRPYHRGILLLGQTGFLIGPLLYLYLRALISPDRGLRRADGVHLFPFAVALIYFGLKVLPLTEFNPWGSTLKRTYGMALLLQEAAYLVGILLMLRRHRIKPYALVLRNGIGLPAGLRLFMIGFILLWQLKLQSFVLLDVYHRWGFCPYGDSLYFLAMFLLVNGLAFGAMRHPEWVYSPRHGLATSLDDALLQRIRDYMARQKPFLDPDLTLPILARQLSLPTRQLSLLINSGFKQNFCDFINGYRIQEAQRLLANTRRAPQVLETAYEVGFNSKSAFNRAFKKQVGMTPKEFKKSAIQGPAPEVA